MNLGVNIDHIAVLREARKVNSPNLIDALSILDRAGADQVTIHLREDKRHIQNKDVEDILQHSVLPVNLEMALSQEIILFAYDVQPHRVTIVPEKREEVTTEGGLNILPIYKIIENSIEEFHNNGIEVSLFIDPIISNIEFAKKLKADWVELHTGKFANLFAMLHSNLSKTHHSISEFELLSRKELEIELDKAFHNLQESLIFAKNIGLKVAGGHGINYQNIKKLRELDFEELNIGQSIIARSVFVGLEQAIIEMKNLIKGD